MFRKSSKIAFSLNLLKKLDFPLAAPSANIATKTSVTSISDLDDELKNIFYFDGGSSVLGLVSTVLLTTNEGCKILRLGSLTVEEIKKKFTEYEIETIESNLSPGNQLKHYSPNKSIRINKLQTFKSSDKQSGIRNGWIYCRINRGKRRV